MKALKQFLRRQIWRLLGPSVITVERGEKGDRFYCDGVLVLSIHYYKDRMLSTSHWPTPQDVSWIATTTQELGK